MSKVSLSITQEVVTKTNVDVYFSDYFKVDQDVIERYGAFNISLVTDLPLFIDPFLLFNSKNPQYRKLHDDIIKYLRFLKDKSLTQSIDSGALKAWYTFREVEQNWLGFSAIGNRGSGLGMDFAQALNRNLINVFDTSGQKQITKGIHLEKPCLIEKGVGKDNISDFTTNLVKGFLLEYTQIFAQQHISKDLRAIFRVERAYFNYTTESWEERSFELPKFVDSYVILTPKALLTKDNTWINREELIRDFEQIPDMIDNDELRFKVNNYFLSQLSNDPEREGKRPTKKEHDAAAEATLQKYASEIIDYYIKFKEDQGEQATNISGKKVALSEGLYIENVRRFITGLEKTSFYLPTVNSYEEARKNINDLKGYIENNDGYKLFYYEGKRIKNEKELQLLFCLICHNSTLDVNREPNNGRGPVDATLSRGRLDKTLVEFKLASNKKLEQNLQKQVEIYKKANSTQLSFKVIVYFSEDELLKISAILNKLGLAGNPQIILIDARNDSKPSTSTPCLNDEGTLSISPSFGKETAMSKAESTSTTDADTITDVVIITALTKELAAVLRHLGSYQEVQTKGRTYYRASVQSKKSNHSYQIVALSLRAMGDYHAALATQQAIAVWNPSYIILAGIAGGVQNGNSRYLGDLVVGEQIVAYEPGKQTESGIQRRYDVYRPARALLEAAKTLLPQEWVLSTMVPRPDGTTNRVIPHVHFGVVASGEKVVADNALTNELQSDWSQLVGIEMEGIGAAIAAYDADHLPGILLVKGMCDWADASKNDNWQEYAADAAASFVTALLRSEPFKSVVKPQPVRKEGRSASFSGKVKITICIKLVSDWEDLADFFAIPAHHRARFPRGREAQSVWEWLEQRDKLSELEDGLEWIGRDDLVKVLKESQDNS